MANNFNKRMVRNLAVAETMRCLAESFSDIYDLDAGEAYTLGMFHDIGRELAPDHEDPAVVGGLVLKSQGYKYWKEVYYHGKAQDAYDSPLLRLLNYADMTVNELGNEVTIDERLRELAKRYGKNSFAYKTAYELAKKWDNA